MTTPMGGNQKPSQGRTSIVARTRFLLTLDIIMFLLTCVLESLSLTGLTVHEWLGFVLCPLVLLHVVLQWQWVVTQFRRFMTPGAYRARANYLLNGLLLILMAAVLFSGVLISDQLVPLIGEHFGRNRVWFEIHGWLNFTLVVAVALHLALNWDWIAAALRRRAAERPELAGAPARNVSTPHVRWPRFVNSLWRSVVVFTAASLAALIVYLAMAAMLRSDEAARSGRDGRKMAHQADVTPSLPVLRSGRPVSLSNGFQELAVTASVVAVVIVIARRVLRVHL